MSIVTIPINHTSRSDIYPMTWAAGDSKVWSFNANMTGELYEVSLVNVSSFLIDGASVSIGPGSTFAISRDTKYAITPTIIDNNSAASITFKARKSNDQTITFNVPELLSEEEQGTISVYMHPSDNKMTIVDSSFINEDNYASELTWTTDPRTLVDLPVVSGFVWATGFWDYLTDRLILFGRPTTNQSSGGNFKICSYHLSGDKAGQVWDLGGTTQNSYNTISTDTWNTSDIFPYIDYNYEKLYIQGIRKYGVSLSALDGTGIWSYDISGKSLATTDVLLRKFGYNFNEGRLLTPTCFQSMSDFSRLYNMFSNYETAGIGIDNINGVVYKGFDNPSTLRIFSAGNNIANIGGAVYTPQLFLPASVSRRMLVAKMGTYSSHSKIINLYNLDTKTLIRAETTITDANATNYKDGDYLNAIEMFALLTTGTAATSGVRTVHFISKDYDGTNNLLKYKLLLDYDSTYMFTNRKRY